MKVLLVYPNSQGFDGFKPIGLSMLSAVLKKAGHGVKLFDTTFYDFGGTSVHELGSGMLNFKKVSFPKEVYEKKTTLKEDFLKLLKDFNPCIVGFSAFSTMYYTSKRLAKLVKESNPTIKTIIGGAHPTVDPESTIGEECFDMLCIGEGEEAIVELADNPERTDIKNIWFKEKKGEMTTRIIRNPVRPLNQDLDSLPMLDWSIWDERHFLKPFQGKLYKGGDFCSALGCPYNCSYCINHHMHDLYGNKGFYRRKSNRRIADELLYLKTKHNVEIIRFHDEDFLLRSVDDLKDLAFNYKKLVDLPFMIAANANNVTSEKAKVLKEMGCVSVSIGLESADEDYRKSVLNRFVSDQKVIGACQSFKKVGIRTVSYNMLGLPYHNRDLIMRTIELNKKAGFDAPSPGFFYPYKGSKLRDLCIREGFFNSKLDEDEINTRQTSAMTLPSISSDELRGLLRTFIMYCKSPKWVYPLIRLSEKDNPLSNSLFKILRKIYYLKIHGGKQNCLQD